MFIKWIPVFPDGNRAKLTDEIVGFQRTREDGYKMGGCYLYAYDPTGEIVNEEPNHLDERVVYIGTAGSSTSRGICSRTNDFTGTVVAGYKQKNPYANGILFRGKYGEKNCKHLYVAYMPMGYGDEVKLAAHNMETVLLREYKEAYGSLPPCDGAIPNLILAKEILKVASTDEVNELYEFMEDMI